MSAAWKQWLVGLANGAISAFASGVASQVAGVTWKQTLVISATSMVVSVAKYVIQNPLPGTPKP